MRVLERLEQEFPGKDWSLKEVGKNQFIVVCNDRFTVYRYYHFDDVLIPAFSVHKKHQMENENIEGIIEKIKEQGIVFRDETTYS